MALPRPSLTLVLDIDERLDSEALRLEIGRCYAHVCQTLVRTHPADTAAAASAHAVGSESGKAPSTAETDIATDTAAGPDAQTNASAPCNIARFLVKMGTRRYLDPKDEGANELWNDVIERWIGNELRKVGNNMRIFNRRQREEGRDPLMFDWYELDLQNGQLSVLLRCDSTSAVDPSANATITALREAYGNNALGENVERVRMPAPEEYERQRKIGLAAKARREAEKAARAQAEAERARAEAEAAEREAEEAFLESPELMAHAATPDEGRSDTVSDTSEAASARDALGKAPTESDEGDAEGSTGGGETIEDRYAPEEADFALDYRLWQIEYADGGARLFDSARAAFVESIEPIDSAESVAPTRLDGRAEEEVVA